MQHFSGRQSSTLRRWRLQAPVVFFIAVVALIVARPMLFPVLVFGHSSHIDLERQIEVNEAYRDGYVYPRWIADFYFGRGSPIFNYYAPLVYLAGAWIGQAGVAPLWDVKIIYTLCVFLAGIAMYRLVKELWGTAAAAASALIYMCSPYLLVDMYVRSALAELSCFAWLPLAMYFQVRAAHSGRVSDAARAAAAIALLMLSHNIGALLGFPILVVWTLFVQQRASWRKLYMALAAGLGVSAFFWVPALLEKSYLNADANLVTGAYHFSRHFVSLERLWDARWGFGSPMNPNGPIMSTQIGRLHVMLLVPGIAYVLFGPKHWPSQRRAAAALLLIAGVSILFTNRASAALWEHLPLIRYVQFPFRFLMPATIAITPLTGCAVWWAYKQWGKWGRWGVAVLIMAAGVVAYGPYIQARYLFHDAADPNHIVMVERRDAQVLRGKPQVIEAQDLLTPKVLREVRESKSTALDDYLPVSVHEKPTSYPNLRAELIDAEPDARLNMVEERDSWYRFRVETAKPGRMLVHVFDFPGWTARRGRDLLRVNPHPVTGEIVVDYPAGRNEIRVAFEETRARLFSKLLSAMTAMLLVIWIGVEQYRNVRGPDRAR